MADIIEKLSKVPEKHIIVGIIVLFITLYLFSNFIQPGLVSIDPMFAGSNSGSSDGRFATGPVGLALLATGLVLLVIYQVFEYKIRSYLSDED